MKEKYYGVMVGRKTGVATSWSECEAWVKSYPKAKYKKFDTYDQALEFSKGKEEVGIKDPNKLEEGELVAYVDGSFSEEKASYGYGVVLIDGDKIYEFSGSDKKQDLLEMRNVSGEIKAAELAMEKALEMGYKTLYLHYDYMGIEEWALGNWKRNKSGTKNYHEFYREISKKLKVVFIKVKSHSGIYYNELADRLAKESI